MLEHACTPPGGLLESLTEEAMHDEILEVERMKNLVIGIAACFAFVFGIAAFFLTGSTETNQRSLVRPSRPVPPWEEGIVWIDNYAEAIAQARITGKPIFLEFRCAP